MCSDLRGRSHGDSPHMAVSVKLGPVFGIFTIWGPYQSRCCWIRLPWTRPGRVPLKRTRCQFWLKRLWRSSERLSTEQPQTLKTPMGGLLLGFLRCARGLLRGWCLDVRMWSPLSIATIPMPESAGAALFCKRRPCRKRLDDAAVFGFQDPVL